MRKQVRHAALLVFLALFVLVGVMPSLWPVPIVCFVGYLTIGGYVDYRRHPKQRGPRLVEAPAEPAAEPTEPAADVASASAQGRTRLW